MPPLFDLAPGGVYLADAVTGGAVRSYRTLSPLPPGPGRRPELRVWRFALCGTVPGVAPAGRYPAPSFRGARTFLQGSAPKSPPQRSSSRLTAGIYANPAWMIKLPQAIPGFLVGDAGHGAGAGNGAGRRRSPSARVVFVTEAPHIVGESAGIVLAGCRAPGTPLAKGRSRRRPAFASRTARRGRACGPARHRHGRAPDGTVWDDGTEYPGTVAPAPSSARWGTGDSRAHGRDWPARCRSSGC